MIRKFHPIDWIYNSFLMLRVSVVFIIVERIFRILFGTIDFNGSFFFDNLSWFRALTLISILLRFTLSILRSCHLACLSFQRFQRPFKFGFSFDSLLYGNRKRLKFKLLFACKAVDNIIKIFVVNFKRKFALLLQFQPTHYSFSQLFFIQFYQNSY